MVHSRRFTVAVACVAFCGATSFLAQTPASSAQQSAIVGTVVDGRSRAPISDATVTVRPLPYDRKSEVRYDADGNGGFEFRQLPAGRYEVRADKPGYFPGIFGLDAPWEPGGTDLELRQNERRQISITLWKSNSSIAGAVVDDRNEPVVGASIQVLKKTAIGWDRARAPARTDKRGEFRVTPLEPGDYIVVLLAATDAASGIGGVFYPAATGLAGATIIRIPPGEDRAGVIFTRDGQPLGAGFAVAGRLGGATAGVAVYFRPAEAGDAIGEFQRLKAETTPDGRFKFSSVPAGEFRLEAWKFPEITRDVPALNGGSAGFALSGMPDPGRPLAPLPKLPTLTADARVNVTADVNDLVIDFREAAHIRGRVLFDGPSPPRSDQLLRLPILIRPATDRNLGKIPQTRVEADATFQSVGLPAGKYVIAVLPTITGPGLAGWALSSVLQGATELVGDAVTLGETDVDLVVTLTRRQPEISGTVVDASGRRLGRAHVVIFPRDKARWDTVLPFPAAAWSVQTTADELGVFTVRVLPGDYFVAAVPTLPEMWRSRDFFGSLDTLNPVTVSLGDTKNINLKSNR